MGLVETQAGLILSSGAFAAVILAPAWGYASERLGRRVLMLLATALVALSPAVMAVVFGRTLALEPWAIFAVLLGARLVQSAFGAALIPLTQGYVAALTSAERRIGGMGFMTVAVTLGTVSDRRWSRSLRGRAWRRGWRPSRSWDCWR
jgi:MFS family permease